MTTYPTHPHLSFCAEVGSNHCGSLESAIAHVKAAKAAKATHVKFQYLRPKLLTANKETQQKLNPYVIPATWLPELHKAAQDRGIPIGYSVFHPTLVREVEHYTDFLKVSAYDCTYDDFVITILATRLPTVISIAMASEHEVAHLLNLVDRHRGASQPITLLIGTAAYPCPPEDANLSRIAKLKEICDPYPVGLSDHTLGKEAAIAAIALGATYIEKHFRCYGATHQSSPDYPHSISPSGFTWLAYSCSRVYTMLGSPNLTTYPIEEPLYTGARRTNNHTLRSI